MTRCLVTGSAGFIGAHVVEHLLSNTDWEVIGLDSFRHRGDPARVHEYLDPDRYRIYTADLAAPLGRLEAMIGPVDFVINLASESHVYRSIDDPVPFVQNNVNLALTMMEYARRAKPKAFIQFSTDEVYGPARAGSYHEEWDAILPSSPYSASKAAQEALAVAYWRTYGVPAVIVNCMNVFGERQDAEKFVPLCIGKIARGETIQIHSTPDGKPGSRFYLHARNVADALLFLISYMTPSTFGDDAVIGYASRPDRYNLVGDAEVDNMALAAMIAGFVGRPLLAELVDWHGSRPGHDPRYALDGGKLRDLGWKPPVSFEESLRHVVEWTLDRQEWLDEVAA